MDYRNHGPSVPPLRTHAGYDDFNHPPPSPRIDSAYDDNRDIQDDPYLLNPNLPPQRFYGAGAQDAYPRPSLAASEVSLHHPQNPSMESPYTPYDSTPHFHGPPGASTQQFNAYRDEPDSHQMSYLGDSRPYDAAPAEKYRGSVYAAKGSGGGKKKRIIIISVAVVVLIAVAAVCVYIFVIKPKTDDDDTADGKSSAAKPTSKPQSLVTTGGDGSTITAEDGSTFTYKNSFGGFWVSDPNNPFNDTAQAQSYVPPLNQPWKFGTDRIQGVNVGGWLVLEPFISPALFEKYPGTVDEFELSQAMVAAEGDWGTLEQHYATFITERDFAEIAGAGLSWVRIPIAFWAIEVWDGEPYYPKQSWKYFLKAIEWARKYGLRINLDFHSVPGSQNGWNHSGRLGKINFMEGTMGIANAQRTLTYIQIFAQFISQPQYKNVIPMFGVINEALTTEIGQPQMESFYVQAYNIVRSISGVGEGKGPIISMHDGFFAMNTWVGFLPNADRLAMDTHFYFAFAQTPSNSSLDIWAQQPCKSQQAKMTQSLTDFGITGAGEFSLAINDCGLNVNGVGLGTRFEGKYVGDDKPAAGSCVPWDEWENWTDDIKQGMMTFARAEMDALQNWFFWTWKVGNTTTTNPPRVRAPFWSYQLGLENGWMPTDPRTSKGSCPQPGFDKPLQPWMTGGAGAGAIPPSATAAFPWPPTQIQWMLPTTAPDDSPKLIAAQLPSFTPTGVLPSLPAPTFTDAPASIDAGNGIANPQVTMSAYVPIANCQYPDEYSGNGAPIPTPACGAAVVAARDVPAPTIS